MWATCHNFSVYSAWKDTVYCSVTVYPIEGFAASFPQALAWENADISSLEPGAYRKRFLDFMGARDSNALTCLKPTFSYTVPSLYPLSLQIIAQLCVSFRERVRKLCDMLGTVTAR